MANYFTQFSVAIDGISKDQVAWAKGLHGAVMLRRDFLLSARMTPDESPDQESDPEWIEYADDVRQAAISIVDGDPDDPSDFQVTSYEIRKEGGVHAEILCIYGEEGGLEKAALFIQQVLIHIDSAEPVTLEWAETCSKPRPGGFGGGAMVIGRDRIVSCSTRDMVARLLDEIDVDPPAEETGSQPSP